MFIRITFLQSIYPVFLTFCYLLMASFALLSCSDTPQQYSSASPSANPIRILYDIPPPPSKPSNKEGGLLLFGEKELSEEQKDILTRENSLVPINYKHSSAGNINIKTEYEESLDVLNLDRISGGYHIYKEGLAVVWREDPPRTPYLIFITSSYQGPMDFGPWMGEDQRYRKVGQSFSDQFSLVEAKDIQKDEKARHFIVSLYKYLENTEENCLESQKCHLSINPQGNYVVFALPKMAFLFGNDDRHNLIQISITSNDKPGCFNRPFDLLDAKFLCEIFEDGSQLTLNLGSPYKQAVQISGINPELPITYGNSLFLQFTHSTIIGWKRSNFEEEPESIPENSPLSYVAMSNNYTMPFLLSHSLIKINLRNSSEVQLSLDPLSAKENQVWTMKDIQQKLKDAQSKETIFYLATAMPQIKGNYMLQKNLIKTLLNFLEKNYKALYSDKNIGFKIYKRVYGEYNDKHALTARGQLILSFSDTKDPLSFHISINEPSGKANINFSLITNDFLKYIIKNQKPLDLNQSVINLAGFTLGDKIYLRDKKIGAGTAITAYLTPHSQTLTALASYSNETETAAVYESGRDRNISFQKSESVSMGGISFNINSTSQVKKMDGKMFDEYEINGIAVSGFSFFESINNLCSLEGLNLEMGMYDRIFNQRLTQRISAVEHSISATDRKADTQISAVDTKSKDTAPVSANSLSQKTLIDCPYISPQDSLFSGLKRAYFFPKHKLVLRFANRELFSLRIYKKPSKNQNPGGTQ